MARTQPPAPGWEHLLYYVNEQARARLGISGMFTMTPDGRLQVTANYTNYLGHAQQINLANMVLQTVAAGSKKTLDSLTILGRAIALEQEPGAKHIEQANKQLASKMRSALVQKYGTTVERRKQVPSAARANRLSGNLRRAISQPDMAVGTAAGISYINQNRLNAEARHWARINFGVRGAPGAHAGAAQSKAPEMYDILGSGTGGRSAGKVGFKPNVRPPMYLPPGFWEFIGGRAPAAQQRTSRVPSMADDDDTEAQARIEARRAARLGRAPRVAGGDSQSGPGEKGHSWFRPMNKQSGTSSWGADYGGYPRTSHYSRNYRYRGAVNQAFTGGAAETFTRKRAVTKTVRGARRSRQLFWPTRRGARYPTRGVVASNFMDAGFRALALNVDSVYLNMATNMISDAKNKAEKRSIKKLLVKYDARMEIERLLGKPFKLTD